MFPDTHHFDQITGVSVIKPRLTQLLHMLQTPIYEIGSTATPKPGRTSHDYDVQVDQAAVEKYFNVQGGPAAKKALEKYLQAQGFATRITGITVHFALPVDQKCYQVDVEVVADAEHIHKLHVHDIPDNSIYKGVNKTQLLCRLARNNQMLYSPWQGLFHRDQNDKKADYITNDIDQIAKLLIAPDATAADMTCAEAILAKVSDPDALLAQMQTDPNWKTKEPA
jgi:hypothetical protein